MVNENYLLEECVKELNTLKDLQNSNESYIKGYMYDYTNELSEFDRDKLIPIRSVIKNLENLIELLSNPNCPESIIQSLKNYISLHGS
jgi:hypothetical protein